MLITRHQLEVVVVNLVIIMLFLVGFISSKKNNINIIVPKIAIPVNSPTAQLNRMLK